MVRVPEEKIAALREKFPFMKRVPASQVVNMAIDILLERPIELK